MEVGSVRVDGSVRTDFDTYEMIREMNYIERITFCSFLDIRKQIDFIYKNNFGEVKCSITKENEKYTGYLKYQNRYYSMTQDDAVLFYGKVLLCIKKNK